MLILSIINFLIVAFLGYLIGRWADNYLNIWLKDPTWAPHHWIYGLILMIIGVFGFAQYTALGDLLFPLKEIAEQSQAALIGNITLNQNLANLVNVINNLGLWIFSFGLGLFISDLKDFLDFKFFSPDGKTKETRRFWHID